MFIYLFLNKNGVKIETLYEKNNTCYTIYSFLFERI